MSAPRWSFALPITAPLSMNDRGHWAPKAAQVKQLRSDVRTLCKHHRIPALTRAEVQLWYRPGDRRRRDAINLAPTLKAVEDGVVDAGVIPDDCEPWLTPVMPRLLASEKGKGALLFVIVVDRS